MINLVREKNPMPEQAPDVRNKNFLEVCILAAESPLPMFLNKV